jgi:uncharacterized membrane protein
MRSKFAILGHPIHPMLVPVPIGLVVWTLIADIVYLSTGRNMLWYDIAFWSGVAAIVSALIAAVPGFVDYLSTAAKSDARTMAQAHGVMNVIVVALFLAAALLMVNQGAVEGGALMAVVAMHAIGAGILAVSGWIGGELVYRKHIGIVPDSVDLERTEIQHHREAEPRRAR